jgi:hypothetical protein
LNGIFAILYTVQFEIPVSGQIVGESACYFTPSGEKAKPSLKDMEK